MAPSDGENHTLTGGTDDPGTTTAPVKRGDNLIDSGAVSDPTVLKIDIEAGEADELDGLKSVLQNVRLAYIEVHGQHLTDISRSIDDVKTSL
ncbi:FkbM family methyltransferase [Haloarchaeobius amylolyticus]|uniref:FkbM family methyltransferase n=1 Tax=Haloarchaeobius amylolyticus TaxID=1198296 RepID=A0ABD6BCU8_9EURY